MTKKNLSKRLTEYLDLLEKNPWLLANNDQLIRIIVDIKQLETWEAENKTELGILVQDQFITVIRDLVEFPDGRLGGYNRIINTAAFKAGGGGVVILAKHDEKILLIKIFRHPLRAWSIETPRGFGEPGLSPIELAQKEISEEVEGEIEEVFSLSIAHNNSGLEGTDVHYYFAKLNKVGEPRINEGIKDIFWVSVDQLERMIKEGEITDSFTIVAYTKAKLLGLL